MSTASGPSTRAEPAGPGMKTCPMCAEQIKLAAKVCRFCHAEFDVHTEGYCPNEHRVVLVAEGGSSCPSCGARLTDLHLTSTLVGPGDGALPARAPTAAAGPPGRRFSVRMAGWIGEVETHIEGQVITFQGQRVVPRMMRAYNRAAGIATLVLVAFVLWVASSESRIDSGVWAWALLVYAAAVLGGSIYLRVARTEQVAIRVPVQEIEHPKRTFNWPLIVLLFFLLGPIIAGIYAGMAGRRYIRLRTVMEDDGRVRRYRLRATSADNSMELLHEIAAAGGPAA